jgi:hypothetical protein
MPQNGSDRKHLTGQEETRGVLLHSPHASSLLLLLMLCWVDNRIGLECDRTVGIEQKEMVVMRRRMCINNVDCVVVVVFGNGSC